ncbi:MAG: hypothetical protein WBW53_23455 [Terriglobales bacterium]
MSQKTSWWRCSEITVDSNWITTTGMALLLVLGGGALIHEIRNLLSDALDKPISFCTIVLTPCLFLAALGEKKISLKIAFVLWGTRVAARVSSSCLHDYPGVQHFTAAGGSIANQIAFTIILVAIVQWFRSVVRWNRSAEQGLDS